MSLSNLVWLIVAILVISWLLGVGGVYNLGGGRHNFIHILIVIAIIAVIFNVVTGRRA